MRVGEVGEEPERGFSAPRSKGLDWVVGGGLGAIQPERVGSLDQAI